MNFYPKRRRVPQIMIVSLIDIFAILLIFVIVTTTFKVPEADQTALSIKRFLIIERPRSISDRIGLPSLSI